MDFRFLKNKVSKSWVILAPKRAKRPDLEHGQTSTCPFCVGNEASDEVFRIPESASESWKVRAVRNKFPFTQIHEVVVLSPSHTDGFHKLERSQIALVLKTYRHRFNEHAASGQVVIFHNHGHESGESLPHPHSQIAVMPHDVMINSPSVESGLSDLLKRDRLETEHFQLFCPETSEWPDEVWIAPKTSGGRVYGEITDPETEDLAMILKKLIMLMEHRHEGNFPYNFYIYPGEGWYLRLIPRLKRIGGFEFATNIFVNTQDPKETMAFLKAHFESPDLERIKREHKAEYHRTA